MADAAISDIFSPGFHPGFLCLAPMFILGVSFSHQFIDRFMPLYLAPLTPAILRQGSSGRGYKREESFLLPRLPLPACPRLRSGSGDPTLFPSNTI